jgi:hypothetical protein
VARFATTKKSEKNHPVFVYSYYHGAMNIGTGADGDSVDPTQLAAFGPAMGFWHNGLVAGGRTYKRTTPSGQLVTGSFVHPEVGHRDFQN